MRNELSDIYQRKEALEKLQQLEEIMPIQKNDTELIDEIFKACRPYDGEVSINNIVTGFRAAGP